MEMTDQVHLQSQGNERRGGGPQGSDRPGADIGLSESDIGRVAIVVTEATTNLVEHAPQGQLLARAFDRNGVAVIEALALDQGPGIANIGESLRDGYSTAGSPGTGLGAIKRLSDEFDIYSTPGKGGALVVAIVFAKAGEGMPSSAA